MGVPHDAGLGISAVDPIAIILRQPFVFQHDCTPSQLLPVDAMNVQAVCDSSHVEKQSLGAGGSSKPSFLRIVLLPLTYVLSWSVVGVYVVHTKMPTSILGQRTVVVFVQW